MFAADTNLSEEVPPGWVSFIIVNNQSRDVYMDRHAPFVLFRNGERISIYEPLGYRTVCGQPT